MAKQNKASVANQGPLPRTVKPANTGPIDPAFLDRPRPEEWGGWGSVAGPNREGKK